MSNPFFFIIFFKKERQEYQEHITLCGSTKRGLKLSKPIGLYSKRMVRSQCGSSFPFVEEFRVQRRGSGHSKVRSAAEILALFHSQIRRQMRQPKCLR